MGFQNSINNMLGTAAAATALGKHMQNQNKSLEEQKETAAKQEEANKIAKENQVMNALENKPIDEEELDNLTGQEVDLENSINIMTTERDALIKKAEDKRISDLNRLMRRADVMAKEADIEKAKLSLNKVTGKQEAIRMRINRYKQILEGVK